MFIKAKNAQTKKEKNMPKEKIRIEFNKKSIKWILLIVVFFVSSVLFMYQDMLNTVDNTNIFMKSVFEGKFLDFYEISVEQAQTDYAANYGIFIYIILAIWLLPMVAVLKVLGMESILFTLELFWAKMFIVLMTILSAYLIYKIVLFCTNKKEKASLGVFLFLSSMMVFYPVFVLVQLDIISIFLMLLGVYGYLKNNKLLFYFSFFFATPLKMFALILALPLILLREKNLLKVGIKWISISGFIIIEKIIFSGSIIYKYALGAQTRDAIIQITDSNIFLGNNIIVFLALYICILIYSYIVNNKEHDNKTILWICFYVWATFTTTVMINGYWIILVVPFLIINILINDKHLYINTFLETISGFSYFLYEATDVESPLCDSHLATRFVLKGMNMDIAKYANTFDMFHNLGLNQYINIFSTIFAVAIIAILALSKPSKENKEIDEKQRNVTEGMLLFRVGFLYLTTCIIIYAFTAKTNPIFYSNLGQEITAGKANLIDINEMDVVTQQIKFDREIELEELTLKFLSNHIFRNNFAVLNVEIWNVSKNECIFGKKIGCSSIIDDEENFRVNLKKTKVNQNDDYEIKLTATKGIKMFENIDAFYPYFTKEVDENIGPAKVNGEPIDSTLYFQIR